MSSVHDSCVATHAQSREQGLDNDEQAGRAEDGDGSSLRSARHQSERLLRLLVCLLSTTGSPCDMIEARSSHRCFTNELALISPTNILLLSLSTDSIWKFSRACFGSSLRFLDNPNIMIISYPNFPLAPGAMRPYSTVYNLRAHEQ